MNNYGFEIIKAFDADGKPIARTIIETNYGYADDDECRAAALKRCAKLGREYIYRIFTK